MVWYSQLFQNFPQFIVIHTVKGFGIVNKAEIDAFLELSCIFDDSADVGNLVSGSSAFYKTSLNIRRFMVHVFLDHIIVLYFNYFNTANKFFIDFITYHNKYEYNFQTFSWHLFFHSKLLNYLQISKCHTYFQVPAHHFELMTNKINCTLGEKFVKDDTIFILVVTLKIKLYINMNLIQYCKVISL